MWRMSATKHICRRFKRSVLQHNTLLNTATYCNTLQHVAAHWYNSNVRQQHRGYRRLAGLPQFFFFFEGPPREKNWTKRQGNREIAAGRVGTEVLEADFATDRLPEPNTKRPTPNTKRSQIAIAVTCIALSYRVVPGHRNWQIETAAWNLAGFLHLS